MSDLSKIKNSDLNWYVLYTYPNYEKKILKISIQRNLCCFLPTHKAVRQWSDRKKTIEVPIFPNYIFAHTTHQDRFKLLDIVGVARFVSFGGRPVIVSQGEIDLIKRVIEKEDISMEKDLVEGERVKFAAGPFEGLEGILFKRKGKTRFAVKIEGINHVISIAINDLSIVRLNKLDEPCKLVVNY